MRRVLAAAIAAFSMVVGGAVAQTPAKPPAPKPAAAPKAAPRPAAASAAAQLANVKVDIPYTKYVLGNGLTLIVHEDHKAPIVSFNIWYHVASKNEPRGRSGFAHLFEHLMFQGSEHFDDDFFKATQKIGATNQNGTTSNDRTNYYQDVPKEALDSILWLESDRMGHLLGAVSQARLDEQRGVVQNEKRQGENQPYGIAEELIVKATYPEEHPYGHTVIGSMDDLNAASLEDVKEWFRTYYGPSNAVLALAGDITPEEAKAKVEKYFGDIPPGPPVAHPKVWVAKRSGAQREVAYDHVAQPRLYKVWNTPAFGDHDANLLNVMADVLSGDLSSRLDARLVYKEEIATNVFIQSEPNEIAGQFMVVVTGKPGADMARIEREVDEEIAGLIAKGPTEAELAKARARNISGFVRGLQAVSAKADILAQSQTFLDSPDAWKRAFDDVRTATAPAVQAAGRRWLTDGSYTLTILPTPDFAAAAAGADRKSMPQPATVAAARFPQIQRTTLANGLKVMLVERHEAPVVTLGMVIDSGYGADFASVAPGTAQLTGALLMRGTPRRPFIELTNELATLGATMSATGGGELSSATMTALKATLDPSLALYADVIVNPAFRPEDVSREKNQQIAAIQRSKRDPNGAAGRVLRTHVFGTSHPYGRIATEASLASISRDDVVRFHQRWFHPNNATLIVVGDTTLAEIKPKLETAFAGWKPGTSQRAAAPPAPQPAGGVIYLVDRPDAQQSVIMAGLPAPARNAADEFKIDAFNAVLGGDFISRVNMNLREQNHWSYGAFSGLTGELGPRMLTISAPVQTDKTKEAFVEVQKEMADILKGRPIAADELAASQNDRILGLAGSWETGPDVANALREIVAYGLPDDYFVGYADKIRAVTPAIANAEGAALLSGKPVVWVVAGDRRKIEAGLRSLNVGRIVVVDADGNPVSGG